MIPIAIVAALAVLVASGWWALAGREWLEPGQLVDEAPETWAADWAAATPDSFDTADGMT